MIRINKGIPTTRFKNRATKLVKLLNDEYDKNEADCIKGDHSLDIKSYYTKARDLLVTRQFNKCCFSEARFNGDYKHVEHFRPKGRVDDYYTNAQQYPGYYWLSYEWSNLYLCKGVINGTYKRNFFPLKKNSHRNKCHTDTHVEKTVLIDPATENPRKHIRFRNDEPYGITRRGKLNVAILGLRDPDFQAAREEHLAILDGLKEGVDAMLATGLPMTHPSVQKNLTLLRNSVKKDAEFSSMAIDFLSGWPHLR